MFCFFIHKLLTMKLDDLYKEVKAAVCLETGVTDEEVLHGGKESFVDARYIMVHLLAQWMTDEEISRVTGLSRTCANKIRNNFQPKLTKYSVRIAYQEVLKQLSHLVIS